MKESTSEQYRREQVARDMASLYNAFPSGQAAPQPIPMVIHCPRCKYQHIDAPDPANGWENPPHKSHLCKACMTVWRVADVYTTGVKSLNTRGSKDTWPHNK